MTKIRGLLLTVILLIGMITVPIVKNKTIIKKMARDTIVDVLILFGMNFEPNGNPDQSSSNIYQDCIKLPNGNYTCKKKEKPDQ